MSFHVGQRIVCIAANQSSCLKKDQTYTCLAVEDDFVGVECCSDHSADHHCGWYRWRFRPAVERKTDISIFTAMLKPQQVEA